MNFLRFLFSKSFLIQAGLLVCGFLAVSLIVSFSLLLYTHHGEKIITPNVIGLTVKEAMPLFFNHHLKCEVIDSIYSEKAKLGGIIEQYPPAGVAVKKGREITLIINPYTIQMIPLPSLANISMRQGQVLLEASGFSLGKLKYVYSDYRDIVVRAEVDGVEIVPETLLKKNTVVDLVVGKGPGDNLVQVPELVGLTLERVKDLLQQAKLSLGTLMYDSITTPASTNLMVFKQYPAASEGSTINEGRSVIVWLTSDEEKARSMFVQDSIASQTDSLNVDSLSADSIEKSVFNNE